MAISCRTTAITTSWQHANEVSVARLLAYCNSQGSCRFGKSWQSATVSHDLKSDKNKGSRERWSIIELFQYNNYFICYFWLLLLLYFFSYLTPEN